MIQRMPLTPDLDRDPLSRRNHQSNPAWPNPGALRTLAFVALFVGCAGQPKPALTYLDRAREASLAGQHDVAFVNYQAALGTESGLARAEIGAKLEQSAQEWRDSLLAQVRAKADSGDFEAAYRLYHQVVGLLYTPAFSGLDRSALLETRRALATRWIRSLLPKGRELLESGNADAAATFAQALEEERKSAELTEAAVSGLAELLAKSRARWQKSTVASILENEPERPLAQRIALLSHWHSVSKRATATIRDDEPRLRQALDQAVAAWLARAKARQGDRGPDGGLFMVEQLISADLGGEKARQLREELAQGRAALHMMEVEAAQAPNLLTWFHLRAAQRFLDPQQLEADIQDVSVAKQRAGLSWDVKVTGVACPSVTDELKQLSRDPDRMIDVALLLEVHECEKKLLKYAYLDVGGGRLRRVRFQDRIPPASEGSLKAIADLPFVKLTGTATLEFFGSVTKTKVAMEMLSDDDKRFIGKDAHRHVSDEHTKLARQLGEELRSQLLEKVGSAVAKRLEERARKLLSTHDDDKAEHLLVALTLYQGRLSDWVAEHFGRSYGLARNEVEAIILGDRLAVPSLPKPELTLIAVTESDPSLRAITHQTPPPLDPPEPDPAVAEATEQRRHEAESASEQRSLQRGPDPILGAGFDVSRFWVDDGPTQKLWLLRTQIYAPMLFDDASDGLGWPLKLGMGLGALNGETALDLELKSGLSLRSRWLTLTGLIGVGGNPLANGQASPPEYGAMAFALEGRARFTTGSRSLLELGYERRAFPFSGLVTDANYGEHGLLFRWGYQPDLAVWALTGRYLFFEGARGASLGLEVWL